MTRLDYADVLATPAADPAYRRKYLAVVRSVDARLAARDAAVDHRCAIVDAETFTLRPAIRGLSRWCVDADHDGIDPPRLDTATAIRLAHGGDQSAPDLTAGHDARHAEDRRRRAHGAKT